MPKNIEPVYILALSLSLYSDSPEVPELPSPDVPPCDGIVSSPLELPQI